MSFLAEEQKVALLPGEFGGVAGDVAASNVYSGRWQVCGGVQRSEERLFTQSADNRG